MKLYNVLTTLTILRVRQAEHSYTWRQERVVVEHVRLKAVARAVHVKVDNLEGYNTDRAGRYANGIRWLEPRVCIVTKHEQWTK